MNPDNRLFIAPGWEGKRNPKACIIGLGLMGGSWAGALHEQGWQVSAVEYRQDSLIQAIVKGWISEGWNVLPRHLDVDLVIIALPLPDAIAILPDLASCLPVGTIVTDVSSLKKGICSKVVVLEEKGIHFIGGHPMTGSEKSGFEAAKPDLFRNYPYVLTPPVTCPAEILQLLKDLVVSLGARIVIREPEIHDREVALISHVPHVLAVALTLTVADTRAQGLDALQLAGRSFREITRIADSPPELWRDILLNNRQAVLEGLDIWQKRLDELRGYIEDKKGENIAGAFCQSQQIRLDL